MIKMTIIHNHMEGFLYEGMDTENGDSTDMIKLLLRWGAKMDMRDNFVELLLKYGANIDPRGSL